MLELQNSVSLQKWPSIESLYNVFYKLKIIKAKRKIIYHAKVKLHGTNAGVQVFKDGKVAAQSRNQILNLKEDNIGFAAWVSNNIEYFQQLKTSKHLVIFGEWCGEGIQKKGSTAIGEIQRKIFVVFAIQYGTIEEDNRTLEICPQKIQEILPHHPDIFILPFYGEGIELDFINEIQLKFSATIINKMIKDIEKIDPWVEETFGIKGVGEGLVFYPIMEDLVDLECYKDLMFKAKGEKHRVNKTRKAAQIDTEKLNTFREFIEMFVTENRIQQAVYEVCGGEFDIKKIGDTLRWISNDIKKESKLELEKSGLDWKEVNKILTSTAMNMLIDLYSF